MNDMFCCPKQPVCVHITKSGHFTDQFINIDDISANVRSEQ